MYRIIALFVITIVFCSAHFTRYSKDNFRKYEDSVRFAVPSNFPKPVYDFKNNPLTNAGFMLGRYLFYDPSLSKDSSIACSNCHQYFAAFANLDHPVSHGVDYCLGTRNAPALFNLAWQKEFMWDGGVKHIEFSPLNAITSSCEMASSLDTIVHRLQKSSTYPALFQSAFGSSEINSQKLLRALAQFTAMLVSANSKYDKHIRHEAGGEFTNEEETGYRLFKQHCSACHKEPLFTDFSFRNNGLELISADPGRDTVTDQETDRGRFKVPSLRNIELSSPYMHDGRFSTLQEVLEHYNSGVKKNANLDSLLQKNNQLGIRLSAPEQQALLAFLKTLTDYEFVNNKKFQQD
ncbi:MAG TPA: cytochrome c peroxidase [Puia sp.]|nr:cytochrome c peroxidase [Puia sp.]